MTSTTAEPDAQAQFERSLTALRPKLHRYCARMTGSVIDGEDVLQDALIKAIEAFPAAAPIGNLEAWLLRIVHNAALDFLRRRARQTATHSDEDPDMMVDPANVAHERQAVAASLRTFMRLPVAQRSSVILMDVLGLSLEEIGAIIDTSIPAVKAALHRGRTRLREFSQESDEQPLPALPAAERARLERYVARFNAHDFDALRDMLAEDVQLDLVGRGRFSGRKEVGRYFHNYSGISDWHLVPALVEGRLAALVRDPAVSAAPYFVLLNWSADGVVAIRDFRYARYVYDGADVHVFG